MEQLRIGLLGAASIAPNAVIRPARHVPGVAVTAVAARDPARAQRYAARHGIPVVRGSYAALLDDPEVDAVYIGLPNGLHAEWTLRAMAAGKHVLCEKPFTSNAAQAAEVAEVAGAAGTGGPLVMEAMHYAYHPLAARLREIVAGELAPVREIEVTLAIPLPRFSDIRYRYDLAIRDGGAVRTPARDAVRTMTVIDDAYRAAGLPLR